MVWPTSPCITGSSQSLPSPASTCPTRRCYPPKWRHRRDLQWWLTVFVVINPWIMAMMCGCGGCRLRGARGVVYLSYLQHLRKVNYCVSWWENLRKRIAENLQLCWLSVKTVLAYQMSRMGIWHGFNTIFLQNTIYKYILYILYFLYINTTRHFGHKCFINSSTGITMRMNHFFSG